MGFMLVLEFKELTVGGREGDVESRVILDFYLEKLSGCNVFLIFLYVLVILTLGQNFRAGRNLGGGMGFL